MRRMLVTTCALMSFALLVPQGTLAFNNPFQQKKAAAKPAKPAKAKPDLDDALLKDLDNELLEGAGDLKDKPKPRPKTPEKKPPADKPPADKPSGKPSDKEHPDPAKPGPVIDGEDIGMPGENEDPLVRISQEMRSVESLISDDVRRPDAAKLQERVVAELAKLIEQAEKQSSQQKSSSSKSKKEKGTSKRQTVQQPKQEQQKPGGKSGKDSNKPAEDSSDRLSNAEPARPDPETLKSLMKDAWGHLPPKAKEQMIQTSPERFLPQYELMIEKYYKRLAEEQSSK